MEAVRLVAFSSLILVSFIPKRTVSSPHITAGHRIPRWHSPRGFSSCAWPVVGEEGVESIGASLLPRRRHALDWCRLRSEVKHQARAARTGQLAILCKALESRKDSKG